MRFRLTIRRWMIAAAVVALVLGGAVEVAALRRRSAAYRAIAREHADLELIWRSIVKANGNESPVDVYPRAGAKGRRTSARAMLEQEVRLRAAYELASHRPWLAVPPEPE